MRVLGLALAPLALLAFATAAPASTVVIGSCDPVTDGDTAGCLFSGNINENPDPTNVNGYVNAQNAYNAWAVANLNPTITLNWLTSTDAGDFGDFGSIVDNGTTGTFDLSGYTIEYFAVKYGNQFTLYEYLGTDGTGNWVTNGQQDMSHIAFFGTPGTAVPEPGTWALMLLGFGAAGYSLRRNRRRKGEVLQFA